MGGEAGREVAGYRAKKGVFVASKHVDDGML
jgi:hypothetical protein